jgi:serine/threonine-protein kinase
VVAFTSYRGNQQAVPNVVGLTQSAASSALTASGYSLSLVSSGYGTAPAGTVIAQNPAAGVIEFPVAGVNLTLSTGSVTVPQVTGLSAKAAGETLIASGLVPNPLSHPGCTSPNVVLSQGPSAHTGVAPGSTVTFNYQSGKTNEGTTCAAP